MKKRKKVKITAIKQKTKKRMLHIILGIIIISTICIKVDTTNIDNAIKCNKIKGSYCNEYEIEKGIKNERTK